MYDHLYLWEVGFQLVPLFRVSIIRYSRDIAEGLVNNHDLYFFPCRFSHLGKKDQPENTT